jgi:hypothetical protein
VPQANGSEPLADPAPIRVEDVAQLTNRELIFRVPDDLAAGHYKVEVRCRFGKNSLRIGRLEEELMVS